MDGDLTHVLLDRTDEVVASWAHRFDRSALRVPCPTDPRQHAALVATMVTSLGEAVMGPRDPADRARRPSTVPPQRLRPGGPELRELERAAALAGASLSASGASGYDVAALVLAVRDAVLEFAPSEWAGAIGDVFEWLVVISLDSFASAGTASAQEKAEEQLETGTPVVLVTPEVPAVLLIGAPSSSVLDSVLARALLLVVRVGAPTLVLDVSGLTDPVAGVVREAASRFFGQKRMGAVEVVLSGGSGQVGRAWVEVGRAHGVTVTPVDSLDAAVARALDRAGVQLRRRAST